MAPAECDRSCSTEWPTAGRSRHRHGLLGDVEGATRGVRRSIIGLSSGRDRTITGRVGWCSTSLERTRRCRKWSPRTCLITKLPVSSMRHTSVRRWWPTLRSVPRYLCSSEALTAEWPANQSRRNFLGFPNFPLLHPWQTEVGEGMQGCDRLSVAYAEQVRQSLGTGRSRIRVGESASRAHRSMRRGQGGCRNRFSHRVRSGGGARACFRRVPRRCRDQCPHDRDEARPEPARSVARHSLTTKVQPKGQDSPGLRRGLAVIAAISDEHPAHRLRQVESVEVHRGPGQYRSDPAASTN